VLVLVVGSAVVLLLVLVAAVGQSVSGTALFTEQTVHLEVALPWMLSMLAGTVKKQIEQQGHKLLGQQPKA